MKTYKTRKSTWMCVVALGCAALILTQAACYGVQYNFNVIPETVGSSPWPTDSGLNLFVETSLIGSQIQFKFVNSSSFDCSMTQIYFDDDAGVLSGIDTLDWGLQTGVNFIKGTENGKLPGGENVTPRLESAPIVDFSAASVSPVALNGINSGQWLSILLNLKDTKTVDDVTAAFANDSLRIGVHVQSFPDQSSASYVTSTPEPATLALLGLGSVLLSGTRRK